MYVCIYIYIYIVNGVHTSSWSSPTSHLSLFQANAEVFHRLPGLARLEQKALHLRVLVKVSAATQRRQPSTAMAPKLLNLFPSHRWLTGTESNTLIGALGNTLIGALGNMLIWKCNRTMTGIIDTFTLPTENFFFKQKLLLCFFTWLLGIDPIHLGFGWCPLLEDLILVIQAVTSLS